MKMASACVSSASADNLAADIAGLLTEAEGLTKDNSGLTLIVAFNYGARQEIVEAARRLARDVREGRVDVDAVGEDDFAARLDTADFPDPDLIIRTSGEMRLSNFLLWQAAYAELVFLPILWPDFDDAAFVSALQQYAARERRFGAVARSAVVAVGRREDRRVTAKHEANRAREPRTFGSRLGADLWPRIGGRRRAGARGALASPGRAGSSSSPSGGSASVDRAVGMAADRAPRPAPRAGLPSARSPSPSPRSSP